MSDRGPIFLKRLAFFGPAREKASVSFDRKATVICGASDTGKSFTVEALDFLLGASEPLRDIPQRVGYDRIRLVLQFGDSSSATLERSVEGGAFRVVDEVLGDDATFPQESTLKQQHAHERTDNISGWLLHKCGLLSRRIRRNKAGATTSLSFRTLANLILVDEEDIIKQGSPFQTGQFVLATPEYSTLKLLLTGVDDSAVVDARASAIEEQSSAAKLNVIDALIAELETELTDATASESDLADQFARLGSSIQNVQDDLERTRVRADEILSQRHAEIVDRGRTQERQDEIAELLARFDLLSQHYKSDLNRLSAIRESGSSFVHLQEQACPLCGTPPTDQHHKEDCDGDVAAIISSSEAEIKKIELLQAELENTRSQLRQERQTIEAQISERTRSIADLSEQIDKLIAPALTQTQFSFRELADKRSSVARDLDLYRRVSRLKQQRQELLAPRDSVDEQANVAVGLSKSILDQLSDTVQGLLRDWHFPGAERVYFDETSRDFVIGGKPRGSFGKGFRAVTHAAATIGLMQFCLSRSLPHPGFVILDSPLLAYWEPEGPADSLAGSDLRERFFDFLASSELRGQVIIIENEHPQPDVADRISTIVFTRNPSVGRYGLFPLSEP
jgi:hypothetical protein